MSLKSTLFFLGFFAFGILLLRQSNVRNAIPSSVMVREAAPNPHMTLWRVDSAHLTDQPNGTAILWPCDSEYYFHYLKNTTEDIIVEIKNDGDGTLTFETPLTLNAGSYGPVNIFVQPSVNTLASGEETHFIVRHTGGATYIHSEVNISIKSNDGANPACMIKFEVGTSCGLGGSTGIDADHDMYCNDVDCDDNDADEHPDQIWYIDADNDQYGGSSVIQCLRPTNGYLLFYLYGTGTDDCNDNDEDEHPNQTWYIDADNDRYGASSVTQCLQPPNGHLILDLYGDGTDDCNDSNVNEHPDQTWYIDDDGDGYVRDYPIQQCLRPTHGLLYPEVLHSETDCNDNDPIEHPNQEWYVDNDQDGYVRYYGFYCSRPPHGYIWPEVTLFDDCNDMDMNEHPGQKWYIDRDEDGHSGSTSISCARPYHGYFENELTDTMDCDDDEPDVWVTMALYRDEDGDGYTETTYTTDYCTDGMVPVKFSLTSLGKDCFDQNNLIHPGAVEICDGYDNDCDGLFDEDITTYYADVDGDNYYNPLISKDSCDQPLGYISLADADGIDCNDEDNNFTEICPMRVAVAYVDSAATGAGNGTSWNDAFNKLQDALLLCIADTIKVAKGTYYPDEGTNLTDNDRTLSFNIPDSIVMLGGYGTGADSLIRNWVCNKTILCGNIQQDNDSTNNSYHVVVTHDIDSSIVFDGFCISDGNANGVDNESSGGGWFNSATSGHGSSPTILNCIFTHNTANYGGGGIYNKNEGGNANPVFINCRINGNVAGYYGGGTFNSSEGAIGGTAFLTMINCILSGNVATSAGGGGGAVYTGGNGGSYNALLINCVLSGNKANNNSGALFLDASDAISNAKILNSIIWSNSSALNINPTYGNTHIDYSIIQQSGGFIDDGHNKPIGINPQFKHAPSYSMAPTAEGNFHLLSSSPAIDMGTNMEAPLLDFDFITRPYNTITDIGAYETQNVQCNSFLSGIAYVDSTAVSGGDGATWATAFNDLQLAIQAKRLCGNVDTIKVARGTYYPSKPDTIFDPCNKLLFTITPADRSEAFYIPDSSIVLGGYASGGSITRNWITNPTILSGDIDHLPGKGGNTYNVVKTVNYKDTICFDGFIIQDGNAVPIAEEGGGWWDGSINDAAYLKILHTTFRNNTAIKGGGFYGEGERDLLVYNSEFYEDTATDRGGAIYFSPIQIPMIAHIKLVNLVIHHNVAFTANGGGAFGSSAGDNIDISVINSTITQNKPNALSIHTNGQTKIINSIIYNNTSTVADLTVPLPSFYFSITNSLYDIVSLPAFTTSPTNLINVNPQFINPLSDFRLKSFSPAINTAANIVNTTPIEDFIQSARPFGGGIDMGAYEFNMICTPNTVVYVDSAATGANDGTSWTNAYSLLQDALLGCATDTIKVAKGTYYPDTAAYHLLTNNDRTLTFNIPDSIVVMGGYKVVGGIELNRKWMCNKTILCGDIDGNHVLDIGNSYHVVTTVQSNATIVDGFCISGGNANEDDEPKSEGGGWFNVGSGTGNFPIILNCVISNNYATYGGGMFNDGENGNSSPLLTNVIFSGNSASNGGGIYNYGRQGNSSPVLTNVIISGNSATSGGGMFNSGFQGNSSPILTNVVINGNKASSGGAMYNTGSMGSCRPVITNSILWNNEATNGPVFYNFSAAPSVSYSFIQNKNMINDPLVTFGGGSIDNGNNYYQDNGSNPWFVNPQVASSAPTTAGDFHVLAFSQAIDMGLNDSVHVTTDLDGDPRIKFSRVDIGAYEHGNAIDCNLYAGLTTVYVDSAATTGANNGTSWANAFTDLQDGLAVAKEGCVDTVKVAEGTYYPSDTVFIKNCDNVLINTVLPNKSVSFDIPDSAVVLGGYGHGIDSSMRDFFCNKTILCGDIDHDGKLLGNCYHVVTTTRVSEYTVVDGFFITGGNAVSPAIDFTQLGGGGFYNEGTGYRSNPVMRNLIISGNSGLSGGGVFNSGLAGTSSPTIINCIISGNTAIGGAGGGIVNQGRYGVSNPVITNCIISGNYSDYVGGGMYNNTGPGTCKPVITNSIFWNNSAPSDSIISQTDTTGTNISGEINNTIITHSILQPGHLPSGADITDPSNKRSDPLFISAPLYSAAPTNAGDFHVISGSPAIDMGDNAAPNLYTYDLDGKMRIINNTVDIGAFEYGISTGCSTYAGLTSIYVDSAATGMNIGTSWKDAFKDLQDALAIVRSCGVDTVKVARGTYYPSDTLITFKKCSSKPDTTLPDRNISFNIPDATVILGGYGHGKDSVNRNWECNKTILCGDIDRNDLLDNGNSYHVVRTTHVSDATVIDGIYISGGNANGIGSHNQGGGWYNDGSETGNSSNPSILNVVISGNNASRFGGGMYNNGSNGGDASPTLTNMVISENNASGGGGINNFCSLLGKASPILTNVMISGNNANQGGGILNTGFSGSSANPILTNVVISGNTASGSGGGGISNFSNSGGNASPILTNVVINGNSSDGLGGGIHNVGSMNNSRPVLINCILWNNTAPTDSIISEESPSTTTITSSIIQSGSLDPGTNISSITNKPQGTDPLFISPPLASSAPTTSGDFHVTKFSPAIDMGLNVNSELTDLEGNSRVRQTTIDIGAYEYPTPDCSLYSSNIIYVDSTIVNGDGTTWLSAFHCLQDALEVAYFCDNIDTIKVAKGTYFPSKPDTTVKCKIQTITPVSRSDFFFLPDGITMLGGYANCVAGVTDPPRDVKCNPTILSGDIDHDGTFAGNSYNVIKTIDYKDTITMDGFVVEWGDATPIFEEGGGWWDGSSADSAKLNIRHTIFRNNKAVFGGGFYGQGPRELMMNQTEFYSNIANCNGGGAYINPFTSDPGDTAFIRFENVLWYQNNACEGGALAGVVAVLPPDVITIVNNTFTLNSPDAYNSSSNSIVSILNTIMWNDVVSEITGTNVPIVNNSIIQGGFGGIGNKSLPPLFIDPTSNFRLSSASPAFNMGDNSFVKDTTDLDYLSRINFGTVDIGAYEALLNCTNDTLYVNADGSVPSLPLDSIADTPLSSSCRLIINGVRVYSDIPFDCSKLGPNNLDILLIKDICTIPDTLSTCTKVITLLDTFPKLLTAIGNINVSLDAMCMRTLTVYDVLANFFGCMNDFEIHIIYPFGTNQNVPDNKLDRTHLGYCMPFVVKQISTGNSTWGRVCVEDKLPPYVGAKFDTLTCYELGQLPSGSYKVADNCSDSVLATVVGESYTDYGCDSVLFQGKVTRQIVAKDAWGNAVNQTSTIYIRRIALDSVICARDTAVDCSQEIVDIDPTSKVNLVSIKDPIRSGAPKVQIEGKLVSLWPNSIGCKLTVSYKDEKYELCGASYKIFRQWRIVDWCTNQEKICKQWIEVIDKTAPVPSDTTLTTVYSSPHDCGQYVDLPLLNYTDCNTVTQSYILRYNDEGTIRILNGKLPASHIWLPTGSHKVEVTLVDACNNSSSDSIYINVIDNTPPTPICDGVTQVTVDPVSCWAAVAAKDLDNGSHDNCCSVLHFAAAMMENIEYWRTYWNTTLEKELGKTDFWRDKSIYDAIIEDWINCYVFSDTVQFDACGSKQVVLRVYEACGIPRYDPHVWPCSPHAWFCYNTYQFIADFNYNWFDPKGAHSCNYKPDLTSIAKLDAKYSAYEEKGYLQPQFRGAAQYYYCDVPFYYPGLLACMIKNKSVYEIPNGGYCSDRLYNDCMVTVLIDDKQAPTYSDLSDITIYCDGAPDSAAYPKCGGGEYYYSNQDPNWPNDLRFTTGVWYGYYGGSAQYDTHQGAGDHSDPQACAENKGWAPVYCKSWLYMDTTDQAGHINPSDYFDVPVFVDKKRSLNHKLLPNEFIFKDNCILDTTTLTQEDNGTLNGCSEGWIKRTWTIKDMCGNQVTATQKIIVKHRSDFEVLFPADKIVTCDFLNRTDTSERGAGRPVITDDECEQIGMRYSDEIFTVLDSACYKIVRTWTLIDWCLFDANQSKHYPDVIVDDRYRANSTNRSCVYRYLKDNNDGYMQYVQIIKVIDSIAPDVTCSDQTVCIDAGCSTTVNIPLKGTDNCADQVVFRVDITRPDGTHDKRSEITAITGSNYTAGLYKIQIIGKDRCGNEDTCNMNLTVKDCKKPTPYCLNGVATVVMPSNGRVTVWAKDLDHGSTDNCEGDLIYSFSKDKTNLSKDFTCADITNGRAQEVPVQMWVTDKAGNQDFCSTYILLEDNGGQPGGVCKDTLQAIVTISGKLQTEEKEGVESATVEVKSATIAGIPSWRSSIDGSYQFGSIPINGSYTIKAMRDDQPLNGVSTLDLVLIQKHILGNEYLKTPYKMIAADVNADQDISVVDLLELRKLILGIYDKLPSNTSWKFIPKSYAFPDTRHPWVYPTEEVIDHMTEGTIRDFVGIKIGDVNASAIPHSLMGTEVRSNERGLILEVKDQTFRAGDRVAVSFRSPNFKGVSGFQGTMSTNNQLRSTNDELRIANDALQGALNISKNNFGYRWENEGLITMSWNTNTSMDVKEEETLFTMHFIAKANGRLSEVLRIGSQHTIAESYEGKGELGNLSIRFVNEEGREVTGRSELYQNYPNPFDHRTVIGLNLADAGRGTFKVTDVTGRVIKVIEQDWTRGYHEVWLDRRDIQSSGVLFYNFESKTFKAVKRMVIIE